MAYVRASYIWYPTNKLRIAKALHRFFKGCYTEDSKKERPAMARHRDSDNHQSGTNRTPQKVGEAGRKAEGTGGVSYGHRDGQHSSGRVSGQSRDYNPKHGK